MKSNSSRTIQENNSVNRQESKPVLRKFAPDYGAYHPYTGIPLFQNTESALEEDDFSIVVTKIKTEIESQKSIKSSKSPKKSYAKK
jgi:hypothetical protein